MAAIPEQMTNILGEAPVEDRHGRLSYTTDVFVDTNDIRGRNVLNIGCGYGWFEIWALSAGVSKIAGTEIGEENLATAKKHIRDPRAVFEVASAIDLKYPQHSFDTVTSWEVIEHIPRGTERKMFFEVSRVLKPGGVFYLSTPNKNLFSIVFDVAFWLNKHRHYSPRQLTTMAESVGLKMERVEIKAGWLEIADIWNMFASKWIFRRERFFKERSLRMSDVSYRRPGGFNSLFVKFRKK
jgi:ubiquinone/menaquinone biosynthesis C-methylase UbiE